MPLRLGDRPLAHQIHFYEGKRMRSVAQGLLQMPVFGLVGETISYLLSVTIAVIVIKVLVGVLVTEYVKVLLEPTAHFLESKAQVKVR
jgi:hypothetical protein